MEFISTRSADTTVGLSIDSTQLGRITVDATETQVASADKMRLGRFRLLSARMAALSGMNQHEGVLNLIDPAEMQWSVGL